VPGWHEKTRELQEEGKIQVVGIVQEQHAERTRLFMQWKRMNWPILVDSLNLLGVSAVPITLLIDEYGIIRVVRPSHDDLNPFISGNFRGRDLVPSDRLLANEAINLSELETKLDSGNAKEVRAYADASYLWEHTGDPSRAISLYHKALELHPESGQTHFRLGVAYRRRYDSASRESGDFAHAVHHWEKALEIDPNQYIWRRRIQQYGPRLDKPYSFYDWVRTARKEISARGEVPIPLVVEPGGAEFAHPAKDFESAKGVIAEPDPEGKIRRDLEGMIRVETILVPNTSEGESSYRAHLVLRPVPEKKAHWNNEADDMEIWVSPPKDWLVNSQHLVYRVPAGAVSEEERRIEFEVRGPSGFAGRTNISAYALYYVCEDVDGTCLYRRQDITLEVEK
jgi:tetratricopeptide (TPR) repeat protein